MTTHQEREALWRLYTEAREADQRDQLWDALLVGDQNYLRTRRLSTPPRRRKDPR